MTVKNDVSYLRRNKGNENNDLYKCHNIHYITTFINVTIINKFLIKYFIIYYYPLFYNFIIQ